MKERERDRLVGGDGEDGEDGSGDGGFQSRCSVLSVRHVGASTFKMQIRERRSGRKRRRKRKSTGWQVFYWGQLPLLCPTAGSGRGGGRPSRSSGGVMPPRR